MRTSLKYLCLVHVMIVLPSTITTSKLQAQNQIFEKASRRADQAISNADTIRVQALVPSLGIKGEIEPSASSLKSNSSDQPLAPDPSAAGRGAFFRGSPGHFVPRSCDLFLDDKTDFNKPTAITTNAVALRALYKFDMDLDPLWDGGQKLTRPGRTILDPLGGFSFPQGIQRDSKEGDPMLYIDLASFYHDNEPDETGGFWANWKIFVTPVIYADGNYWWDFARFQTKFRGPFWSGEKLEVGDTNDGFRPQVMHYENFGIWNWNWSAHNAVEVRIIEGDGGFFDDHIASIIVRRDETMAGPLTLADTGDIVGLFLTSDNRFNRVVVDGSRRDRDGRPRTIGNPDAHDVDVAFSTRPLRNPINPNLAFTDRYVVGFNRLIGPARNESFGWQAGSNLGPKPFRYIDDISYTPGWDCESKTDPFFDPFDVDDDFEFFIYPNETGGTVVTNRGGCNNTTTLFFRSTTVSLPDFVQIKSNTEGRIRIPAGTTRTISISKASGYLGFIFTELLGYETGGDDDVGFRIQKSTTATHYIVTASVFDAPSSAAIHLRATVIEWPSSDLGVARSVLMTTRAANSGTAQGSVDVPIPNPSLPYFVINEILTYDPDTDDDMSWSLYFEPLSSHVNFQLASGNASNSGAYVEAEARIVQFQSQGSVSQSYVDGRNDGFENGTAAFPWNTVEEGVNWVSPGGNVLIAPGTYPENFAINKACTLLRNGAAGAVIIGRQ